MGAQEVHFPALLPARALRARPTAGPSTATTCSALKDRKGADYLLGPDPRGDVHPARQGPVLVVQGPAAVALPDPDQVPRRGAAPGRPAARPRVRDEGLLLVRHRRRRAGRVLRRAPRRLHPHLRPARPRLRRSSRRCPARWAARRARSSSRPAAVGEDTYVRCTACDYAANVEARAHARPARSSRTTTCPAAHVEDTPDTPTIETLVALANAATTCVAPTASGPPRDTLKNVVVKLAHARRQDRAARHRRAGRPRGRRQAARGRRSHPSVVEPFTEEDFAEHPGAGPAATSGPAALGRRQARRRALPARPARGRGHPLDHRRQRARSARLRPGRRPRLHRRRHDRGGRGARGRPLPERRRRHAGHRPRHRDGPHLPARPQVRRGARPQGARRERQAGQSSPWAPTASASSRAVAAIAEATHDEIGLCWPRAVAPADVHLVATGKDDAVFEAAQALADDLVGRGLDRALRRPARCLAGREVQGRRAARHADDRRGRARAWPTAWSRCATGVRGEREDVAVAEAAGPHRRDALVRQ